MEKRFDLDQQKKNPQYRKDQQSRPQPTTLRRTIHQAHLLNRFSISICPTSQVYPTNQRPPENPRVFWSSAESRLDIKRVRGDREVGTRSADKTTHQPMPKHIGNRSTKGFVHAQLTQPLGLTPDQVAVGDFVQQISAATVLRTAVQDGGR